MNEQEILEGNMSRKEKLFWIIGLMINSAGMPISFHENNLITFSTQAIACLGAAYYLIIKQTPPQ